MDGTAFNAIQLPEFFDGGMVALGNFRKCVSIFDFHLLTLGIAAVCVSVPCFSGGLFPVNSASFPGSTGIISPFRILVFFGCFFIAV